MPRLSSGAVFAKEAKVPASPVEEGLELIGHTTFTSRRRFFRPAPRSTATSGRAPGLGLKAIDEDCEWPKEGFWTRWVAGVGRKNPTK